MIALYIALYKGHLHIIKIRSTDTSLVEFRPTDQPMFGFGSAVDPDPNLMAEIQNKLVSDHILSTVDATPFVFLKNPFDAYHMKRHTEMQLTR